MSHPPAPPSAAPTAPPSSGPPPVPGDQSSWAAAPAHPPTDAPTTPWTLSGRAAPGWAPAWLAPAAVGVGALAACAVVAVRDPGVEGSYGFCPFLVLTGHDCPGCGMLRGSHALFNGDPLRALDHNALLPVVLVLLVVSYVRWTATRLGRPVRELRTPPWAVVAGSVGVLVFWVARNLGGPFELLSATPT